MSLRLRDLAPWVALAFVLVAIHLCTSRGALDDLSTMYSNAWLEPCTPDDALPRRIREHFEAHGPQLDSIQYTRYEKRLVLSAENNYVLLAQLIRLGERLGAGPGLRNVMLADLVQHLLALSGIMTLALATRQRWMAAMLLLACLGALSVWPARAGSFVAFQSSNMSWFSSAPRGAATLAAFGAVAATLFAEGRARIAAAAAFALLSLSCHRSMAILYFGLTLPAAAVWYAVRRLEWRPGAPAVAAMFAGLVLLAAGVKLGILWRYDSTGWFPLTPARTGGQMSLARSVATLVAWGAQALAVLLAWMRTRSAGALTPELRTSGDMLAALLTMTGAVSLGANAVHPDMRLWFGPLFFVTEASMRSVVVANSLVFALLGLTLHARSADALRRATPWISALAFTLAGWQLVKHENPPLPRKPVDFGALLARGARAYADETTYYYSLARHVAEQGCGAM